MVPPVIGIADNGDFPRIMSRFDIGYLSDKYEERYFAYFLDKYRIDKRDHWESKFVSSQTPVVALAVQINRLISKPGFFDIRAVGAVHLALELAAAWLLLTYAPVTGRFARAVLVGIVILMLTDAGFISYFNSFYNEPGTFVFLLLTLGAILMVLRRPSRGALLLFCVAGLLFITSKPQNVGLGIILAVYALRLGALRAGKAWRWACAGVAVCLFSGSVVFYTLKSDEIITKPSYYISVFYEILRFSPDPRRDLTELGLDPDLAKYTGTIPFALESPKNDPDFQRAFFDRMSFGRVIRFHLRHPVRFLGAMERSARYAPLLRPALGNYEKSAGHPPFTTSQSFDLWSRAHKAYSPGSLLGFSCFFAVNLAGIVLLYGRKRAQHHRLLLELQAALLLMAAIQFLSVVIAQGDYEPVKHLFLFNLLVNICFASALIWLADCAERSLAGTRLVSAVQHALPARFKPGRHATASTCSEVPNNSRQPRRPGWPEGLVMAAIAAALVWQLLLPPLIGLADQGDFSRIMGPFDIGHLSDKFYDRYFAYFESKYRIDKREHWDPGFVSSQALLVALALRINSPFSKPGIFDIRFQALILMALELVAAWLLLAYAPVKGRIGREALLVIVFLMLTDVGYVAYFNSFYSESSSFVFFLLTIGFVWMAVARPSYGSLLGIFAASLLFVTSKPQNVSAGIILAVFLLRLSALQPSRVWRWACAGVALCLFSSSLYYSTLTPRDVTTKPAFYLSVFYEMLPYSPSPRQDLIELGLDPKLLKYSGTRPWSPQAPMNDPDFERSFFDKISLPKIIRFHLRHPIRLLGTLERCAGYAPELRPWVGNYEKSEGRFAWAESHSFNLWSTLRNKYSPGSVGFFALFFAANLVGIALLYHRNAPLKDRLSLELQAALVLMAILQFLTVAVGAGTHEATKHLFLFDLLVDACFVGDVLWLAGFLPRLSRFRPPALGEPG